jgi:transglutaminase-like putative cysteine protease
VSARRGLLVALLVLFRALLAAAADRADYSIAAPANWVEVYELERAELEMEAAANDGALYLLSDKQERWDGQDSESYYRVVTKVSEPDALSNASSIQLEFDPRYQQLTIHAITIRRGDQTLDRLASARIDVLQREESLERRLLDGHRTISVEMQDVRVGDLVDYSYTRSGRNPVWRGHYFRTFSLEYGVPVGVVRVRLTVPADRYLHVGYVNEKLTPIVTTAGAETTYEWMERNGEGVDFDEDAPDWFIPDRAVQVTSFRSWREVTDVLAPFYEVSETLSPELQAAIHKISRSSPDPKVRLREILALIQRDIRYLGIELGVGGYVPSPPSLVFERRFGDCKDKSLLMVTMAQAMGITAFPAIVDSNKRIRANEIAPDPGYFDHVVVLARVGEESFWLDPTRTLQSGTLDRVFQPDFRDAMVLEPGAVDLVEMNENDSQITTVEVDEVFDLSQSFDGAPAVFRVTTNHHSYRADLIREDIRADGIGKLHERYFNYYKGKMPTLVTGDAMTVDDNVETNRVTIHEFYSIESPWRWNNEENRFEFSVAPYEVDSMLGKPNVVDRSAPYEKTHPINVSQKTEVILPFGRAIDEVQTEVEHPAFRYTKKTSYDQDTHTVGLEYRYISKADAVAAEDVDSYLAKVQEADNLGWYWVSTHHLSERGKADLVNYELLTGSVVMGYFILLPPAWFFYRKLRPVIIRPDSRYFPVTRTKFLLMSALTCGFYVIYWAYRSWLSVNERGVSNVRPRLSGAFYPVTYFWLLRDVNRIAGEHGEAQVALPWMWAVGLLGWEVASGFAMRTHFFQQLPVEAALVYPILNNLIGAVFMLPCVMLVAHLNPASVVRKSSRFGVESWLAIVIFLPISIVLSNPGRPTEDITDVAPSAVEYLAELQLLDEGETVEAFRAPNNFRFRHAGSVITDQKVLRYWTSEDFSDWYSEKAAYEDIVSITFEGAANQTKARFVRRQGDTVDLALSTAEGDVVDVIKKLVERSPFATVTYKGMDALTTAGGQ